MARECANCGKTIEVGDDYIKSYLTKDNCYCSEICMREDIYDKFEEDVVHAYVEEKGEWYTEEADDPYDRYGVSERDFA